MRVDAGAKVDFVIFGGEDHKTGQTADPEACFQRLESTLTRVIPKARPDSRWSGQVIETNDGLPFIGESAERQFVATGFAGNGMTFGTLAGIMARDWVMNWNNPWQALFAVDRKKLRGGTLDYLKENIDFPYYYLRDRLAPTEASTTRDVKRGEGKIIKLDGQRGCLFTRRGRQTPSRLRDLHPHGMHRPLEFGGTDLGLPLSWFAVPSRWQSSGGPGRDAAGNPPETSEFETSEVGR